MFRHSPLPVDFNTSTIGVLEIVFATTPDTTMIENVIMSSHAFYFGLTVEFFSMKNRGVGEDRAPDP